MSEIRAQLEPSYNILAQGIRDLSFENHLGFGVVLEEQPEIDIDIQANGKKIDDETYEVVLMINVEAKQEEKTLFIAELEYMGLCQVRHVPEEVMPSLLMIQTPSLLFPFARQIIADVTSNAGFPPLFLQPVDFAALFHSQAQEGETQTIDENTGVAGTA